MLNNEDVVLLLMRCTKLSVRKTCRDTGVPPNRWNVGCVCGSDGRGRLLAPLRRCRWAERGNFPWESALGLRRKQVMPLGLPVAGRRGLKQQFCPSHGQGETIRIVGRPFVPRVLGSTQTEKVFPVLNGCTTLLGSRAFKRQQELVGDYRLLTSVYLRSPLTLWRGLYLLILKGRLLYAFQSGSFSPK